MKLFSVFLLVMACSQHPAVVKDRKPIAKALPVIADSVFKSLAPAELLPRLFNSTEISGKTICWKPASSEPFDFELSCDGKFHTELDTVFFFTDLQNTPCAAVIFRTYRYDEENRKSGVFFEGSPVGTALFFAEENHWRLYRFNPMLEKLGYLCGAESARKGKISLKVYGPGLNCLYMKQEVEGKMGQANGHESFYSLDRIQLSGTKNVPLSQIFFNDYLDYETEYEMAVYPRDKDKVSTYDGMTDKVTEVDKSIKMLKRKKDYDLIRLKVSTRKNPPGSLKTKIMTCRYNEMQHRYVEVK